MSTVFPKNAVLRWVAVSALLVLALAAVIGLAAQDDATPYLGVTIAPDDAGARVLRVMPDSPADAAGLRRGDVIAAVDETEVTADTLAEVIQGYAIGDTVTLRVIRGARTLELTATLAERPAAPPPPVPQVPPRLGQPRAFLGVTLEQSADGVQIADVVADSPAAEAGLQVGDIIVTVNGATVQRVADVVDAVRAARPGDALALTVERGGERLEIEAVLGQTEDFAPGIGPMRGLRLGADLAVYLEPTGVWHIVSLDEDGALYAAGLRAGDVVTAVDGEVRTPDALDAYLNSLAADAEVTLTIERDGTTLDISVPASALAALNRLDIISLPFFGDDLGRRGRQVVPDLPMMRGGPRLGVAFQTLNAEIAAEKGLDVTEGALIVEVAPNSPAEQAGLQVGDVVTAVDGDPVDARRTLAGRLLAYEPGDTVVLTVWRAGETLEIEVVLGQFEGRGLGLPFFFGGRGSDESGRFFHFMIPPAGRGFRFELFVPPAPEAPPVAPAPGANV